jgi:hypothetical protein
MERERRLGCRSVFQNGRNKTMTTYTLVTATTPGGVTILIASPPDGDQAGIDAAIAEHREMERQYEGGRSAIELIPGCTLTDDEPEEGEVVWSGNEGGWLMDENSKTYKYAVTEEG